MVGINNDSDYNNMLLFFSYCKRKL